MESNSILKLQVDDKQYEASLKNAQQGLTALQAALRNSGKSFADVDRQTEQYVRELGKMEATAKTTRGRIGEMSSAFVELSRVEKQLTDQERQSPVGKALAESLAQLKQRTIDAKNELQGLENQIKNVGEVKLPDTGGLFGGGKLDGMLQVFGGNLMTKAAGFAASFASEIGSCVQQGIELARQGEGIRIAFERLGRGDILQGLREATHGTVTDLELMKAAVKFNDFKLPLDQLGTMLAFAQQKAKDTGQSVDYMVDSIVTGLGRKSLMILDNLGLSANEIKDKMKQTGDMTKAVGAIIREQMAKAGDYVETAADRAAQANVSLQNKMEELGRKFAPIEEASNQLWTSMKIGILDIIGGPLARLLNGLTEAGRLKNMLNDLNGGGNGKESQTEKALRMLREYSGGGRGIEGKRDLYNRQVASYTKQEENAWRNANRLRAQLDRINNRKGKDPAGYDQSEVDHLTRQMEAAERRAKAIQIMRANYQKGAAEIMNATKTTVTPTVTETKTPKVKATKEKVEEFIPEGSVADLQNKMRELQKEQSKVTDPTDWQIYASLIANVADQIDILQGKTKKLEAPDMSLSKVAKAELNFEMSPMNFDAIDSYIGGIKSAMKDLNIGDEMFSQLTEKMKDATTVSTLLQEMMERGLAGADLESTAQALKKKLLSPEGIDQTAIQSFLEELNKQIEEAGGVGLKLNADTGEVTDDREKSGKNESFEKFTKGLNTVSSGLNNVTSGLKTLGLEIPTEFAELMNVISGVGQIISGVQTIISLTQAPVQMANTTAIGLNTAAIGALIAALEVNSALSILPLAGGGIVPRAAFGRIIPGNSFSGDNLFAGNAMVNSGELVLNRAQQGVLASELQGRNNGTYESQPYIDGEQIFLGLQAYMRRSGKGEIVTANR